MTRRWTLSLAWAAGLLLVPDHARSDGPFERMLSSARVPAAPAATLEVTLSWLQEKTAAHGTKERGAIRDSISFEGCQARQVQERCGPGGTSSCVPVIHSFSLADLRARVSTTADRGFGSDDAFTLCVEAVGGRVRTRLGEVESSSSRLCFSLLNEDHMRTRFARALTHAIELCRERARKERAREDARAPVVIDEPF